MSEQPVHRGWWSEVVVVQDSQENKVRQDGLMGCSLAHFALK